MDKELQRSLNRIHEKLDKLTPGVAEAEKKKTSLWKRVAIVVPIVVALFGLIGTGWELTIKFFENRSKRTTIDFYNTLATRLLEEGNYEPAETYLESAKKIDPNNANVVRTQALLDMRELIRSKMQGERFALLEGSSYQSKLDLEDSEFFYHIWIIAKAEQKQDIADEYLEKIIRGSNRYSLLARSRLIRENYLPILSRGNRQSGFRGERELQDADVFLIDFARDVKDFDEDPELTKYFQDHMNTLGLALLNRLPRDKLVNLEKEIAAMELGDNIFWMALHAQVTQSSDSTFLENLKLAQKSVAKRSLVAQQLEEKFEQYSVQTQLDFLPKDSTLVSSGDDTDLEAQRLQGIKKRNSGEYGQALEIFQDIVVAYQDLTPDKTLYKTHFNLGLLYEYYLSDLDLAIEHYQTAENLEKQLGLQDASIHNTFGYLYFKRGRDARDPDVKKQNLDLAEQKLNKALEIDPAYAKSRRNLKAVAAERQKLKLAAK
ncbi:MAG: hypothetical protein ACE5IR_14400 [bacterium]